MKPLKLKKGLEPISRYLTDTHDIERTLKAGDLDLTPFTARLRITEDKTGGPEILVLTSSIDSLGQVTWEWPSPPPIEYSSGSHWYDLALILGDESCILGVASFKVIER